MEKTMEKIVALARTEDLYTPDLKYTVVLPTPGITEIWA